MVKKRRKLNQKRVRAVVFGAIIAMSWMIVGIGNAGRQSRLCTDVVTHFTNSEDNLFLNKDTVEQVVKRANGMSVRNSTLGEINVAEIELALEENPYVKAAEVYEDALARLVVEVEMRRPIARVICLDGSSFYLDRDFRKMRVVSSWVPNVPVVRGVILEPLAPVDKVRSKELLSLKPLLLYMDGDRFFRSQISEVILTDRGEVLLEPEIGDLQVIFGKPEQVEEKFENLRLFYHKVLSNTDRGYYKSVNLKYKNKIFAKKRS